MLVYVGNNKFELTIIFPSSERFFQQNVFDQNLNCSFIFKKEHFDEEIEKYVIIDSCMSERRVANNYNRELPS